MWKHDQLPAWMTTPQRTSRRIVRREKEGQMSPRLRVATFSLPLFFICCFLCLPSEGTGGQGAAETSADVAAANRPFWHQETTEQPDQDADAPPPAKDTDPLFPIVEHGKWGYIDKTGKVVIKPEFYYAGPFKEGMARIQPFAVLLSKAIRVYF